MPRWLEPEFGAREIISFWRKCVRGAPGGWGGRPYGIIDWM
jgi:hypothetical protein